MIKLNDGLVNFGHDYLFGKVKQAVDEYKKQNPKAKIINTGIGDVTLPLTKDCVKAMKKACAETGKAKTFRGYGPYNGYAFLREKIAEEYKRFGVDISADEVFVSDGAKSDLSDVLDLFSADNVVLISDPSYPQYKDANEIDGRKTVTINAVYDNGFLPLPDEKTYGDVIYLCSPANPTGAVYDEKGLGAWVDFAKKNESVIIFDRAYEGYVKGGYPKSIYEIEGGKEVSIEISSFSKNAGFTGIRCGYTVIPESLTVGGVGLSGLYALRQSVKRNGVSYITQRGAEATFSDKGRRQIEKNVAYYKRNAKLITETLESCGCEYVGGESSPYIFMKCPYLLTSEQFFGKLLYEANLVTTPGVGFGKNGEGFVRLTAFLSFKDAKVVAERLKKVLRKCEWR